MNIPLFDQSRVKELSSYGESVRLSNELRAVQSSQYTRWTVNKFDVGENKTYTIPAKWGFDCETADYSTFTTWLNSNSKKSQSLFWFVIRIMAWRFPTKHAEIKTNLAPRRRLEFDLVLSQMKKESEWVGTVGYSNMVRLDGTLNNSKNRIIKGNSDNYRIVRN